MKTLLTITLATLLATPLVAGDNIKRVKHDVDKNCIVKYQCYTDLYEGTLDGYAVTIREKSWAQEEIPNAFSTHITFKAEGKKPHFMSLDETVYTRTSEEKEHRRSSMFIQDDRDDISSVCRVEPEETNACSPERAKYLTDLVKKALWNLPDVKAGRFYR